MHHDTKSRTWRKLQTLRMDLTAAYLDTVLNEGATTIRTGHRMSNTRLPEELRTHLLNQPRDQPLS